MKLTVDAIPSPVGTIVVAATERGICALDFEDCRPRMDSLLARRFGRTRSERRRDPLGVGTALRAYFDGSLDALHDVPLDVAGTEFQMRVWRELRRIPPATTISYAQLATALGTRSATRAVGTANGRNPVALVVPCHRVVRTGGALGGYAGGLERKRWLLDHEQRVHACKRSAIAAAG